MSMERLTKHGETSHENGICCTHFYSKECIEVQGNCAYGCKWEEEAWSKLAEYEDLEEQGILIKLPIAIGETVYKLSHIFECEYDYECKEEEPFKCECNAFCEHESKVYRVIPRPFDISMLAEFGKTVFLTKAEAEKALAEMGE